MIGKNQKKVIVAMSGGVDSSVAAALLKKDGYEVVGVFMKFWSDSESGAPNRCCSPESEKRARQVAEKLDIPFYVFNFEKEFKKKVVDYFLKESKTGFTPNPCVVCNKEIKFGLLFKKFPIKDNDYIATGHYVKKSKLKTQSSPKESLRLPTGQAKTQIKNKKIKEEYKLLKAEDKSKDQSYFLWQLNQKILKHCLFPVGNYAKPEVRKMAGKFKLPVSKTSESQEACFISKSVNDFLKKYLKTKQGLIIDKSGKTMGGHQGLWFYTIGQRKGIGLSSGPFYVIAKDIKKNLLIVSKNKKDLLKKELSLKKVNWISGKSPKLPLKVRAKIRYGQKSALAVIKKGEKGEIKIVFSNSQKAVTPGQSAVFYKGEELLGGGTIIL